jgi:non-heme chloroperoxidase
MPALTLPDGTTLHYLDEGPSRERPLVLIHGEPFSTWFWQKNIPALARTNRVIAFDVRGRGASSKGAGGDNVVQFARDLEHVLTALQLQDVVVVGWSLGAAMVWSYLEQFGEARLGGYVNIDQRPYRVVGTTELERLDRIKTDREAFHRQRIREYLGPNFPESDEVVNQMVAECLKTSTASHLAAVEDIYKRDFRLVRTSARLPSSTFWSAYGWIDEVTMTEMRASSAGDWAFFPRSGHLIPWTEPELLNRELLRFAASL